jgi:hypothetical protein
VGGPARFATWHIIDGIPRPYPNATVVLIQGPREKVSGIIYVPSKRTTRGFRLIMEPEPAAGYFSTFSLHDPSHSSLEGQIRPQKRNRRVFVCIQCHRRKLKCDKGQPCSRCVLSDTPNEGVYQQHPTGSRRDSNADSRETPRQDSQTSPQAGPAAVLDEETPGLKGVTHWSTIASEVSVHKAPGERRSAFQCIIFVFCHGPGRQGCAD